MKTPPIHLLNPAAPPHVKTLKIDGVDMSGRDEQRSRLLLLLRQRLPLVRPLLLPPPTVHPGSRFLHRSQHSLCS